MFREGKNCAVLRCLLLTYYQGTATREDIDTTLKLGMNHPMGPLRLGKVVYYRKENSKINNFVRIQRICAFLMISLKFGSTVANVLIASVLTPVWLFNKHYTRELAIRNTVQAFFSNEWLMLSGMERKTGKDSTNTTTDE